MRRISFFSGLLLGGGLCALVLGTALVHLFTGKLISLQVGSQGVQVQLNDLSLHKAAPREASR